MKKQLDCAHYIRSSIARLPDEPSTGAGAQRSGLGSVPEECANARRWEARATVTQSFNPDNMRG